MRSPDEILDQIRTRYANNWRDWLVSPPDKLSFSLAPPSSHSIAHEATAVATWLQTWRDWAAEHPAARLRTVIRRSVIGEQQIYTHVDVHGVESLVDIADDCAEHWHTAVQRCANLSSFGAPHAHLRPYLAQITTLDNYDFELLLRVAHWFTLNPSSGLTIRQVPVPGLHTKWLAQHRSLVLGLLGLRTACTTLPDEQADDGLDVRDLDILGLRPLPANVDVILADPEDQRTLCGLRHVRAPLEEIAGLSLRPRHVLIVENKQSALPVPDRPGLVIIHSLGNFLDALGVITWITGAQTWYWGDLDRAGFTLLSRARTRLPEVTSVLMNRSTLAQHNALAVQDPTGHVDPPDPTLTAAERETLAALTDDGNKFRLEQERIPWSYVEQVLVENLGE